MIYKTETKQLGKFKNTLSYKELSKIFEKYPEIKIHNWVDENGIIAIVEDEVSTYTSYLKYEDLIEVESFPKRHNVNAEMVNASITDIEEVSGKDWNLNIPLESKKLEVVCMRVPNDDFYNFIFKKGKLIATFHTLYEQWGWFNFENSIIFYGHEDILIFNSKTGKFKNQHTR